MWNYRTIDFKLFALVLVTFESLCMSGVDSEIFFGKTKFRFNKTLTNLNFPCKIPNQSNEGFCVDISECEKYLQKNSSLSLTTTQLNFLKNIECKTNEESVGSFVCCPKNGSQYFMSELQFRQMEPIRIQSLARKFKRKKLKRRIQKVENSSILNLSNECGKQVTNRIYGGEIAELDEYPWLVLLVYKSNDFGCSGALIDERHVLTAAHCVHGQIVLEKNGLKHVRLGEFNVKTQPDCIEEKNYLNCADSSKDVNVDKIMVHPDYSEFSRQKQNDIAIIRLKDSVSFTHFIMPICLPRPSDEDPFVPGRYFSVSGWGRTDIFNKYYPNIRSPIKLKLRVPIVGRDRCMKVLEMQGVHLGPKQVCAGGEHGRDTCAGDSGGPLMYFDRKYSRWVVYGIVSYGFTQCGMAGRPAVYTNIVGYMNWITNITMATPQNQEIGLLTSLHWNLYRK